MPRLRPGARAVILDESDRILLCRFTFPHLTVWAAPGGGVEPGETPLQALRRELLEEVGLSLVDDPPHVWHQVVVDPGHTEGYDGVINDYFLVRTASFEPRGTMSDEELAAEQISELRWWRTEEVVGYEGPDLFSPRDLATPLQELLAGATPAEPVRLGR